MSEHPVLKSAQPSTKSEPDEASTGLLTRLVRARTLGPEALEALRKDMASDSRIGIGYLGVGAIVAAVILSVRGLAIFIFDWGLYPNPWLTLIAWIVVAIALTGAVLIANAHGSHLPTPAFIVMLVLLGAAVILDVVSAGGFATAVPEVTVIVGAGAALLALVAYRPLNQLLLATLVLAAFLLAVTIAGVSSQPPGTRPQIEVIVAAIAPTLIGILIVRSFSRFIDRELDRTLVESTLSSPRFGVGIQGADELVRLDQSAEELLSDVASGRVSLPLNKQQASAASALASELRLRLVAGRRQTWLQHAIDDSEVLSPTVTLLDPAGLAGYLEPDQREGLLSAVWLIAAAATRQQPRLIITVGPQSDPSPGAQPDRIAFPIDISVEGIPRRRVDVTIWGALDRVGPHIESGRHGSLRLQMSVHVDTPET
ncbi:hypothetical protein [Subtercola lobariae]|uniref:Uncharacterized protein n=1 Tax=Subtercola lobariae TaxID=1588641 RepID=A0A917EYR9_9MICO|nr:hypothetical protein [Subtercola lobariae]GGF25977.1 hypothetical protein GCM10011399_19290 [Subtercola lobariae]